MPPEELGPHRGAGRRRAGEEARRTRPVSPGTSLRCRPPRGTPTPAMRSRRNGRTPRGSPGLVQVGTVELDTRRFTDERPRATVFAVDRSRAGAIRRLDDDGDRQGTGV